MTETNFTDRVLLRLNHTIPVIDKFAVIKKLWWFHDGNWDPEDFVNDPLPEHGAYITLTNSYATDPLDQLKGPLNLFTYTTDNPPANGDCDPLLAIDRGFTVKKDITAGGFVGSNQGELWLGSGREDQLDVPKIILMHADWSPISGGGWMEEYIEDIETIPQGNQFPTEKNGKVFRLLNSYEGHPSDSVYKYNGKTSHWDFKCEASDIGKFDTLYLKKMQLVDGEIDTNEPAHLDLGNLTIHGDLTVYGAAVLNAGILEEIFASAEFASAFTSAFYSSIASIVGAGIGSALQFVGNVLGINPASVPSIGGLTIADDNSVKPATDGHSSIGESTKMMAHIYTRELIIGNYTAHPNNYMTFYDDGTGLNLVMTTSQATGGGILPASERQLNLGSSTQKWQTIYCNQINTTQISGLTNPLTITTSNAPQLTIAASNAAIKFHTDCNIYRTSKTIQGTNYIILETDNPFVCTLLDCNGLSVNNNAGITGNLNVGGTLSFNGSAGSDGQVLKNIGGYPQWGTFPAAQWTAGVVSSVSSPLTISSNALSIPQANGSTNGYLSSGDWNTFNNKYGSGATPTFGDVTISKSSPTLYLACTGYTNYHITSATDNNLYFSNATTNLAYLNASTLWLSNNLYVTGGATIQTNLGVNGTLTTGGLNISNPTISNVTASRQLSVDRNGVYYTYYNTSGRAMLVHASVVITGCGANGYYSTEIVLAYSTGYQIIANAQNDYCTRANSFTFLVPNGWAYQIKDSSASGHTGGVTLQAVQEILL